MTRLAMPSFVAVAVVAALAVAACGGGGSPSSPSGAGGVSIKGVVLGGGASTGVTASDLAPAAASGGSSITVTVAGTHLSTTVSASGTFELDGVTGGTFTLVFTSNGVEIGRVQITAGANSEVTIVVQVQSSTVVVVNLKVDDKSEDTGGTTTASCLVSGGKAGQGIELEGRVDSGTDAAFVMKVNGERSSGLVDVAAASAAYKCNGARKGTTEAQCRATLVAGAQVHVSGTLTTCTTSKANVTATEVKLQ